MLGQMIAGFVAILFAAMLVPYITQQTSAIAINISSDGSTSGFISSTLLGIIPLLFVICVAGVAIAVVYNAFRSAGMLGDGYDDDDDDDDDDEDEIEEKSQKTQKPRKQTYLEYVKERREIERIMGS